MAKKAISYSLVTISGLCLVGGVAILAGGRDS